jgi:arginyl-tRNA--protein-N-Asp/Glu arginylyltransferase
MEKGWRRCGEYYYKPDMEKSCCQLNTIRLEAEKYVPNKKQRKIMGRFNRYLLGTYTHKDEENKDMKVEHTTSAKSKNQSDWLCNELSEKLKDTIQQMEDVFKGYGVQFEGFNLSKISFIKQKKPKKGGPTYSTNCLIALMKGSKQGKRYITPQLLKLRRK